MSDENPNKKNPGRFSKYDKYEMIAVVAALGGAAVLGKELFYMYRYDEHGIPRTHDAVVDAVTRETLAEIRRLEKWETGEKLDKNYVIDPYYHTACSPGGEPSNESLISFGQGDKGATMRCKTRGGIGEVKESAKWTSKGGEEDPDQMEWSIRPGREKTAKGAAIAVTEAGFTAKVAGFGLGDGEVDSVKCTSNGKEADFTCETVSDGRNGSAGIDNSKGKRLLEWLREQVKSRIKNMMENLALTKGVPQE